MGVFIRRWVWLESIGVVSGCFPHITYISLLHLYLFFLQQHPYFFFHFIINITLNVIPHMSIQYLSCAAILLASFTQLSACSTASKGKYF